MYARVIVLKTAPGKRAEVETLADQAFAIMKSLPGFISVHFVTSEDNNKHGSFSLWESKEEALAAGESIRSQMAGGMEELVSAPPTLEIFEVYKPG